MTSKSSSSLEKLKNSLIPIMSKEVSLLREILGNALEEQKSLLHNEQELLKSIVEKKDSFLAHLEKLKGTRKKTLKRIEKLIKDQLPKDYEEKEIFLFLMEMKGSEGCQLATIKEQIVALVEKIKIQTERNNYLLHEKIHFNQKLISGLHPDGKNPTYSMQGKISQKKQTKTLTLVNEEG